MMLFNGSHYSSNDDYVVCLFPSCASSCVLWADQVECHQSQWRLISHVGFLRCDSCAQISTDNHFIRLFKAAHQMYIATWIKSIQPFMYYYAIWIRVYTAIVTMPIIVVAVYVIFCCSSILQRKRDIQYIIIIRHRSLNKESTIPSSSILMTYQVKLVTVWCKVKHISWLARLSLLLLLMVSSFCTFVLACRHMLPGHFCRSLNRRCPARVHCSKHGHKYPRQEWHKGLAISLLSFQDHT